ncbi:MAG: ribonuclease HI family protein [Spirochaetota bacterium]|nr:MAG: ribonuclease HI family protein [Spirochaetota bacterium]
MNSLKVFIDGGCKGNPGEGAFGFVISDYKGELYRYGEKLRNCTNNSAEYRALIGALLYLLDNGFRSIEQITVYSDSELLVHQMNQRYKVRSRNLLPLFTKAKRLAKKFNNISIEHIRRSDNRVADRIVKRIFDNKTISPQ